MAKKKIYGLTSILLGAIAVDGGMGTDLTEVFGATQTDSASLVYTPPTFEKVPIEEKDGAYETIMTDPGGWKLSFKSYNVSAKTMSEAMGGTYTAGTGGAVDTWTPPVQTAPLERSAKVTTRGGAIIDLPRISYVGAAQFDFAKSKLGTLDIGADVLEPTKANTASVKFSDAPA